MDGWMDGWIYQYIVHTYILAYCDKKNSLLKYRYYYLYVRQLPTILMMSYNQNLTPDASVGVVCTAWHVISKVTNTRFFVWVYNYVCIACQAF